MKMLETDVAVPSRFNLSSYLLYFFFMLAIFSSILFAYLWFDKINRTKEIKHQASLQIEYQKSVIIDKFDTIRADLLFLPQLNEILKYKEISNEETRAQIANEFLAFTKSKEVYDQLRYLNKDGLEIVRINYNNGSPAIVADNKLQSKGDRYYFLDTMARQEDEVYVSPFDLNKENGRIETPLKPMIRFGTPVFDKHHNPQGILIFNYLGNSILDNLQEATKNEHGSFSLLNMAGYWLYSDNHDDEWGFMYENKVNFTMANRDEYIWQQISSQASVQFTKGDKLITSTIVQPFDHTIDGLNHKSWILVNTISLKEMGVGWGAIYEEMKSQYIIIILLSALFALSFLKIITEKNRLRLELEKSAMYDELTGLANRKLLLDKLTTIYQHSKRDSHLFAIIFIDLDGFKNINDTMGHDAGDELLKKVATRLQDSVRKIDTVSRYGGDEFIVILSKISNQEDCEVVSKKILSLLTADFMLQEGIAKIGASLGVALGSPYSDETIDELLIKADSAMYEVKKSGKCNFKIG